MVSQLGRSNLAEIDTYNYFGVSTGTFKAEIVPFSLDRSRVNTLGHVLCQIRKDGDKTCTHGAYIHVA